MSTGLLIILVTGAAFAGWAALSLLGGERARRLHQVQSQRLVTAVPSIPTLSSAPSAATPKASPTARAPTPPAAQNSR